MAGISFLNNESLVSSPTLSQGQEGAAVRPDSALEAPGPESARQMFPRGISPLTEAEGPLPGTQEGERPGLDPRDRPAFRVTISPAASRLARGFWDRENPAQTDRAGSPGATGGPNGNAATFAEENRLGRVRSEGEGPSSNRTEERIDPRDPSERVVPSTSESAAEAVLRTGLLRALSRVTAPPPPIPDAIDRYA